VAVSWACAVCARVACALLGGCPLLRLGTEVLGSVQRRPTCGRGEGAAVLYVGLARRRRQGAACSFGWRARTVSSIGRLHLGGAKEEEYRRASRTRVPVQNSGSGPKLSAM